METNCNVPLPVTFNCWKHHVGFIKEQIKTAVTKEISEEELRKILLLIGESQMDIYLGKLTPQGISESITNKLRSINLYKVEKYKKWLNDEGKEFQLLTISDDSDWTLRLGQHKERYIHIHPARNSPKTRRIKAPTLKTVITVLIKKQNKNLSPINTSLINEIRVKILNLPPVKKVTPDSAVARAIKLFT